MGSYMGSKGPENHHHWDIFTHFELNLIKYMGDMGVISEISEK